MLKATVSRVLRSSNPGDRMMLRAGKTHVRHHVVLDEPGSLDEEAAYAWARRELRVFYGEEWAIERVESFAHMSTVSVDFYTLTES